MTKQGQLATMTRRRTNASVAALVLGLCTVAALELGSTGSLSVSEAETENLEFLDGAACALDGSDGVPC